jgi:oxaloacetate decarboxylase beta subunit
MIFGAAAQFGIFFTLALALLLGFPINDAASAATIGAADGPTAIFVLLNLNPNTSPLLWLRHIPIWRLCLLYSPRHKSDYNEKRTPYQNAYQQKQVSKTTLILFPIIITIVAGIIAPKSVALVGFLMFGNLIRACGVLDNLSETAQNALANLVTILLGISVASQMEAGRFVTWATLKILLLGLVAFIFDTIGGVMLAKFINLFSKTKINPMIGACGISAFPMSARVIHKMGLKEDNQNFLLMHAIGVNVSGQISSVIAGGLILSLFAKYI